MPPKAGRARGKGRQRDDNKNNNYSQIEKDNSNDDKNVSLSSDADILDEYVENEIDENISPVNTDIIDDISPTSGLPDVGCAILLTIGMFYIYYSTSYTKIPGGNTGELVLAVETKSVLHPPGHPLFLIVNILFSSFMSMFGLSTLKSMNILSSICGALTCCFIFLTVVRLTPSRSYPIGYMAAIIFGLSETVWTYSIQTNVFSLNNFFCSLLLFLSLVFFHVNEAESLIKEFYRPYPLPSGSHVLFNDEKTDQGSLFLTKDSANVSTVHFNVFSPSTYLTLPPSLNVGLLTAFMSGLALTNQYTCILTIIPTSIIILTVLHSHKYLNIHVACALFFAFTLGLVPYLYLTQYFYLPFFTIQHLSKHSWGDLSSVGGIFTHLFQIDSNSFQPNEYSDSLSFTQYTQYFEFLFRLTQSSQLQTYLLLLIPVLVCVFVSTLYRNHQKTPYYSVLVVVSSLLLYLCVFPCFYLWNPPPTDDELLNHILRKYSMQPCIYLYILGMVGLEYICTFIYYYFYVNDMDLHLKLVKYHYLLQMTDIRNSLSNSNSESPNHLSYSKTKQKTKQKPKSKTKSVNNPKDKNKKTKNNTNHSNDLSSDTSHDITNHPIENLSFLHHFYSCLDWGFWKCTLERFDHPSTSIFEKSPTLISLPGLTIQPMAPKYMINSILLTLLGMYLTYFLLLSNYLYMDRSQLSTLHTIGTNQMNAFSSNAIVILHGELEDNLYFYLRDIEGTRTDISLVSLEKMAHPWFQKHYKFYPNVFFPGEFYNPYENNGYSFLEFISVNIAYRDVYFCGKPIDDDDNLNTIYLTIPFGMCELYVEKHRLYDFHNGVFSGFIKDKKTNQNNDKLLRQDGLSLIFQKSIESLTQLKDLDCFIYDSDSNHTIIMNKLCEYSFWEMTQSRKVLSRWKIISNEINMYIAKISSKLKANYKFKENPYFESSFNNIDEFETYNNNINSILELVKFGYETMNNIVYEYLPIFEQYTLPNLEDYRNLGIVFGVYSQVVNSDLKKYQRELPLNRHDQIAYNLLLSTINDLKVKLKQCIWKMLYFWSLNGKLSDVYQFVKDDNRVNVNPYINESYNSTLWRNKDGSLINPFIYPNIDN